jgi:hypothetical protein
MKIVTQATGRDTDHYCQREVSVASDSAHNVYEEVEVDDESN